MTKTMSVEDATGRMKRLKRMRDSRAHFMEESLKVTRLPWSATDVLELEDL